MRRWRGPERAMPGVADAKQRRLLLGAGDRNPEVLLIAIAADLLPHTDIAAIHPDPKCAHHSPRAVRTVLRRRLQAQQHLHPQRGEEVQELSARDGLGVVLDVGEA